MKERDQKWEDWDLEIRCVWTGSKPKPKPEPVDEIPDDPGRVE